LRNKIWSGQFVELAELLPPPTFLDRDCRTRGKQLQTPPSIRIEDFVSVFHSFIVIRSEKFLGDAPGMLKHLETVQTMSRCFGPLAWTHYDCGFRWAMQHDASIQWGCLDVELYMQATALGLKSERNQNSFSRPNNDKRTSDKLSGPPQNMLEVLPRRQVPAQRKLFL
jgi:hypothetical protein